MATRVLRSSDTCCRCLLARRGQLELELSGLWSTPPIRLYSARRNHDDPDSPSRSSRPAPPTDAEQATATDRKKREPSSDDADDAKGPMARRLEEATEDALLTGGTSGRRAVEDAGFSEELKEKLLDKVQSAKFRSQYASAFASAGLDANASSSSRGQPARSTADAILSSSASSPWSGEEPQPDAVLRMLDDAKKRLDPSLRGKFQTPNPVDLRPRREPKRSPGQRAAAAREQAGLYSNIGANDENLSDPEREERRRHFRERFQPAGRDIMPNSISGFAALANERIEDAIARGAFRDIPRGKDAGQRDARADNPFIDTTEYLMNKMIQRQEIVPPWIEKQQELTKAASAFRARLRNDWRRHAARMIASQGGPLEDQVRKAEGYARAERRVNPQRRRAAGGSVSGTATNDPVMVKVRESAVQAELAAFQAAAGAVEDSSPDSLDSATVAEIDANTEDNADAPAQSDHIYSAVPFRDPAWEATERSYMTLSVDNLNALARSYNLMAPELAKKPYFSLERELKACYADVAPHVSATIRERATRPAKSLLDSAGDEAVAKMSVFDRFGNDGSGAPTRVHDSKKPHYGFKEMWRDWWGAGSA